MAGADEFRDGGVLAVFSRADHPIGYGFCQGEPEGKWHHQARAHGYVTVVVMCRTWPEMEAVTAKLRERPPGDYDGPTGYRQPKPGFDPWGRGDPWYAGPYERVWVAQVEGKVRHVTDMHGRDIDFGSRPSYGDNRAMAYLTAEEVLGWWQDTYGGEKAGPMPEITLYLTIEHSDHFGSGTLYHRTITTPFMPRAGDEIILFAGEGYDPLEGPMGRVKRPYWDADGAVNVDLEHYVVDPGEAMEKQIMASVRSTQLHGWYTERDGDLAAQLLAGGWARYGT